MDTTIYVDAQNFTEDCSPIVLCYFTRSASKQVCVKTDVYALMIQHFSGDEEIQRMVPPMTYPLLSLLMAQDCYGSLRFSQVKPYTPNISENSECALVPEYNSNYLNSKQNSRSRSWRGRTFTHNSNQRRNSYVIRKLNS